MKQIQKLTYQNIRCMQDCTPTGIHLYFDVMGPLREIRNGVFTDTSWKLQDYSGEIRH